MVMELTWAFRRCSCSPSVYMQGHGHEERLALLENHRFLDTALGREGAL